MQKFKPGDTVVFFDADPNVKDKNTLDCWKTTWWPEEFEDLLGKECQVLLYQDSKDSYLVKFSEYGAWHILGSYLKPVVIEPEVEETKLSDYQRKEFGEWIPLTEDWLLEIKGIRKKPKMKEVSAYRWVLKGTGNDPEELWITTGEYEDEAEVIREIGDDVVIIARLDATEKKIMREDV